MKNIIPKAWPGRKPRPTTLRELCWARIYGPKARPHESELRRRIVATRVPGYSDLYVLAYEGTPPKGVIVTCDEGAYSYWLNGERARRMQDWEHALVQRHLRANPPDGRP